MRAPQGDPREQVADSVQPSRNRRISVAACNPLWNNEQRVRIPLGVLRFHCLQRFFRGGIGVAKSRRTAVKPQVVATDHKGIELTAGAGGIG